MENKTGSLLWGLVLFCSFLLFTTAPAFAQAVPDGGERETTQKTSQNFDGKAVYKAVFEAFRDNHIALTDPATRTKWAAEWENKHATDGKLDTPEGTDEAVMDMIHSLHQRFDYYFDEARTRREEGEDTAIAVGIGVTFVLKNQGVFTKVSASHPLLIDEVTEGSPAAKAGLKSGDEITQIDGKPVLDLRMPEVYKLMAGDRGTDASLTYRRGAQAAKTVSINRAPVHYSVSSYRDLGNGVAYVSFDDFDSPSCVEDMARALKQASGAKALVLDLRWNRGGWVSNAVLIGQQLLPQGTLLLRRDREDDAVDELQFVLTRDKLIREEGTQGKPDSYTVNRVERKPLLIPEDMPIVVLVNEYTASSAEIVAGALVNNHRAVVVGQASFGKGWGQTRLILPNGRSLHVTSFQFLPGGRFLDVSGIVPSVAAPYEPSTGLDQQLQAAIDQAETMVLDKEQHDRRSEELKSQRIRELDSQ